MNRRAKIRILLLLLPIFGVACGGSVPSATPSSTASLTDRALGAVWHAELGTAAITPNISQNIVSEDGLVHENTILVPSVQDGSNYIHGVFSIDIPDEELVTLSARVGFPFESLGHAVFRIYVQEGEQFPVLAEATAQADGTLNWIEADLSSYRGQNRLIILAVSHLGESITPALWIDPIVRNP